MVIPHSPWACEPIADVAEEMSAELRLESAVVTCGAEKGGGRERSTRRATRTWRAARALRSALS
jgi:hypothetical protein